MYPRGHPLILFEEVAFLADPAKRVPFYDRLYAEMAACDYQVISIGIRKQQHRERSR